VQFHTYHSLWNIISEKSKNNSTFVTTINFNVKEDFLGDGLAEQ
jgi:hypothetical protein